VEKDFNGRPLKDDLSVETAGVGHWVAVVKRLPAYDEDEETADDTAATVASAAAAVQDAKETKGEAKGSDAKATPSQPEKKEGKAAQSSTITKPMVLLNLVRAAQSSGVLARLAASFARLDNLSHILVWSNSDGREGGEECEVSLVELPRLKTRFGARVDSDGVVRLYSLDYDGLFITKAPDQMVSLPACDHS
jgi:hypothetical protein